VQREAGFFKEQQAPLDRPQRYLKFFAEPVARDFPRFPASQTLRQEKAETTETIQKIWNEYRNSLKKKVRLIDTIYSVCFESLRRRSYYVLHEKPDAKRTALKKDK
jgi:hypothetical protein